MKQTLDDMQSHLAKVEEREHARLIRIAKKSGFLDIKLTTPEIEAVFAEFMKATDKVRVSQLKKLREQVARKENTERKSARRSTERKKILLGSFFVAQARHKPNFAPRVRNHLISFLEADKNKARVSRNKALLAVFLLDPSELETVQPIAQDKTEAQKTLTHMHIILGAYLEWAFEQDTAFLESQREEISNFLKATYTKATGKEKRQLLKSYLPTHEQGEE